MGTRRRGIRPAVALRCAQAVELAAQGCSYEVIAREVGYGHRGSAYRAVKQALQERIADAVDFYRTVEGARLDALQVAIWDKAMAGNVRAVNTVLKIIRLRCQLFNLYMEDPSADRANAATTVVISPENLQHLMAAQERSRTGGLNPKIGPS